MDEEEPIYVYHYVLYNIKHISYNFVKPSAIFTTIYYNR